MRQSIILIFILSSLRCLNCTGAGLLTIHPEPSNEKLYFSGKLKPLTIHTMTSPLDSTVIRKYFEYGQYIKKGDKLIALDSKQLAKDFNQALSSYLSAKDHYLKSKTKREGSKELFELGIISRNEYQADESEYNQSHIEWIKAKYALIEYAQYDHNLSEQAISHLTLNHFKSIDKLFKIQAYVLKLHAPRSGIILMPDNESNKKISEGSQIKLGETILSIGDLNGFSIEFDVSEIDISKLRLKQKAEITIAPFPDVTLEGQVVSIDAQALSSEGSSVPIFRAKVFVSKVPHDLLKNIKVGMSAEVMVIPLKRQVFVLPMDTIYQEGSRQFVHISEAGQIRSREITIGQTLPNGKVEVLLGLKDGDKIVSKQSAE